MGIEYMIFVQPGNKYMTSGNKVYGFLTIRKQIYAQLGKNICPVGKRYMPTGKKIYAQREKNTIFSSKDVKRSVMNIL